MDPTLLIPGVPGIGFMQHGVALADVNAKGEFVLLKNAWMTPRDWFAALAMQAFISRSPESIGRDIATMAYALADEMLIARSTGPKCGAEAAP